jgi:hypothetical protein
MPTEPRETRSPTDDARAADLRVLRRFFLVLPADRRTAALYSLLEESGVRRLRWDGLAGTSRIPLAYAARDSSSRYSHQARAPYGSARPDPRVPPMSRARRDR